MPIYNCKECNIITEKKTDYEKHIKTKKHQKNTGKTEDVKSHPDVTVLTSLCNHSDTLMSSNNVLYECDYCDASFKHRQNKYRHQTYNCKAKKNQLVLIQQMKESHKEEIRKLTEKLDKALDRIGNITNNNNNTTNNNTNCTTNNIIINGYGKEDISYIKDSEWLKILTNPRESITNLFLETHFNPEHPENTNIRQRNRNSKFIEVHDGDNWKNKKKKKMLSDVAEDKQGILDDKVAKNDEIYNSMSERQRRNHDTFHDEVFYNDRKEIIESIEAVILDSI